MAGRDLKCQQCGQIVHVHRNPTPTVDVIIEIDEHIVLIERANEPSGWALPGGFVDYGESLEAAARREAREETGLDLDNLRQFGAYSDPRRDPRQHNISFVFTATAAGQPAGGDDAAAAALFSIDALPPDLCFDHGEILADFRSRRVGAAGPGLAPFL